MIEKNSKSILHHHSPPENLWFRNQIALKNTQLLGFWAYIFDENNKQNKDGKNCYGKMLKVVKSQEETKPNAKEKENSDGQS
jgi:hypothetical protein